MLPQAITIFFVILLLIGFVYIIFHTVLNRMIDGVIESGSSGSGKETFISRITGMETKEDKKVNKAVVLREHALNAYNQNNFQVANDIPLSQTSYAYFINKFFINKDKNTSVDPEMNTELMGQVNIPKPELLYDGIWKADYKSRGDYQRVDWRPVHPINEHRGEQSVDKMFEQLKVKPMPDSSFRFETSCCGLNTEPFWQYDMICDSKADSKCVDGKNEYKTDDIVCFPVYLDPMTN